MNSTAKETKRTAFIRLAEKRTIAVIDRIRILAHCANSYAYEYNEDDIKRIFSSIEEEVKLAKSRFLQEIAKSNKFKLQG